MSRSVRGAAALLGDPNRRRRRTLRLILLPALAALLIYLAWPYVTLWQLDRAIADGDSAALSVLVDLEAIRAEIKKKLNKDADSAIGELSDPFIRWLEAGIQEAGSGAVDRLVTVDWVRDQLLVRGFGKGLSTRVSYAFFDAPGGFRVTLGRPPEIPLHGRLTLRDFVWRLSAVYY
jgi:hypothetical protein